MSKVDKLQKLPFKICVHCSTYHSHVASAKALLLSSTLVLCISNVKNNDHNLPHKILLIRFGHVIFFFQHLKGLYNLNTI